MEDINTLIDRWQDTCFPGQDRPFGMHEYVSDNLIWLSDSRQGGNKVKTSREKLASQIALRLLLNTEDDKRTESCKLLHTYRTKFVTLDPATRRELNQKINELDKEVAKLRDERDTIVSKLKD